MSDMDFPGILRHRAASGVPSRCGQIVANPGGSRSSLPADCRQAANTGNAMQRVRGASVFPLLAGAHEIERSTVLEWRPPDVDTGFFVGVPQKALGGGRLDTKDQFVSARAIERHIGPIVGSVRRDHRMKRALAFPSAALLRQRV